MSLKLKIGIVLGTLWILVSLYFIVIFISRKWLLRKFDGPFAVPLLGNCYTIDALSVLRYLGIQRKKYGKIFTLFAFAKAYLIVCDPVVVRRVLSDTKVFVKGADYSEIFSLVFGQGLVTSSGDKHKQDRSIFSKYFLKANINKYVSIINKEAKRIIDQRMDTAMKMDTPTINIEKFFAVLALRCFGMFGVNFDFKQLGVEKEEKLCKVASDGSWAVARMMSLNLPLWRIFYPTQYMYRYIDMISEIMIPIVNERRSAIKNGTLPDDMDDCLTAMIKEDMKDEIMMEHLRTLIGAGHDTTAFFSSYMAYLLAGHQDVQDKVRKEIIEVMGDTEEVTIEQTGQLKYLQKVMQETLRLYAVIPNVTREATEDVTIKEADVTIPKDTVVLIPFYLINRDPTLWDNPSEFNPDRFEELSSGDASFTSARKGFFPFGYGARTCIGNTLAIIESSIFFTHILRRYKLIPKPGYKPNIFAGISLTTSNGVHVNLERIVK